MTCDVYCVTVSPLIPESYNDQDRVEDDAKCPRCTCCLSCSMSCLACGVNKEEEGVVERVCRLLSLPSDTDDIRYLQISSRSNWMRQKTFL